MVAIHEKHIHSVRYLWQMFVYTSNMFLMLLIAGLLRWCALLLDLGKLNMLFAMLSPEVTVLIDNNRDITIAVVFLSILEFLILCSVGRFIDYDIEHRKEGRKLLFCLGYRHSKVIFYEAEYFLFDFVIAWILGGLLLGFVWLCVRRLPLVQIFLSALEQESFLGIAGFLIAGIVAMLAIVLIILRKV